MMHMTNTGRISETSFLVGWGCAFTLRSFFLIGREGEDGEGEGEGGLLYYEILNCFKYGEVYD